LKSPALSDPDVVFAAPQKDPRTIETGERAETNNSSSPEQQTKRTGEPTLDEPLSLPLAPMDQPSVQGYTEQVRSLEAPDTELTKIKAVMPESERLATRSRWPFYAATLAALLILGSIVSALLFMRRAQNASTPASRPAETAGGANRAAPAQTPAQSPTVNSDSTRTSSEPGDARTELRSLRDGWIAATNARDIERQLSFYAPTLEAFYLQRGVSRQSVRAEKTRLLAQADVIAVQAGEPETSISADGRTATMRFRKSWDFKGAQPSSGEVIQELRWAKTDAGWKITSERDIQVIR
jgi:hypothetical protein